MAWKKERSPRTGPASRGSATLSGIVERVTFHTEDSGYTVMKVTVPKRSEPVTVVGSLPEVTEGEEIEATGAWVDDRQYGRQFKADRIQARVPDSLEGIERYLGSGLIEGIGKKYAKRVVAKFGKEVFEIIDHASRRLEEVEGIGPKRRRLIKASWDKQRAVREIMVFLHENGISTARALRIYKTYGDQSVEVLRKDPYKLAQDIHGVGFKTADEIAGQLGLRGDAPPRILAGLLHVLGEAATQGHTALPKEMLVEEAEKLLTVGTGQVEVILDQALSEDRFVEEASAGLRNGVSLIYTPDLFRAEVETARILKDFASREVSYPEIQVERALTWCEKRIGHGLAPGQKDAIRTALENRLTVITGGPGVGKTTVLRSLLEIVGAKKVRPVLAAPTGRAAKRLAESTGLEAATLHRLLEFQPGSGWGRNRERRLEGDLFVIDEVSMVDIVLMRRFLEALPDTAHVVLVGDADQLPSVGPGTVLKDVIASGVAAVARLTQIYRQAEASHIVTTAHRINEGEMPSLETPGSVEESDFFFISRTDPESIAGTIVELVRDRLPRRFGFDPVKDIQVLTPMNRNRLGTVALNADLQAAVNPPGEFKFEVERFGRKYRQGDKVIQTLNDYDKGVFNGDIGVIAEIAMDPVRVGVRFEDGRVADYEPAELDELQPAYAITIHKSQGSEFPAVIVPVSTQHFVMLRRNLIYTGITRGKKLVVLVGDPKALAMAVKTDDSRERYSGLLARLRG